MPQGDPPAPLYRESRSLAPPVFGWVFLAATAYMTGRMVWSAIQGETGLLFGLPGLLAMWAIGLGAVLAKQDVLVTRDEFLVGHSPRLSKRWPLSQLQRVGKRDTPPKSWRHRWPFGQWRVYALGSGPGVALRLADGEAVWVSSEAPDSLVSAIAAAAPHVVVGELEVTSGITMD